LKSATILPEKLNLFPDVKQAFAIIQIGPESSGASIRIELASDRSKRSLVAHIHGADVTQFVPESAIPLMPAEGWLLLRELRKFPQIAEIDWIVNRRGELDLTMDRSYIGAGSTPFFRGRHVSAFRAATDEVADAAAFSRHRGGLRIAAIHRERIAGHQIANMDLRRRLRFAVISPSAVLGNSLNYLELVESAHRPPGFSLLALLGYMNSLVLDWCFRLTSTNNHVNNYELDQLPIPVHAPARTHIEVATIVQELLSRPLDTNLRARLESTVVQAYHVGHLAGFLAEAHQDGSYLSTATTLPGQVEELEAV
jgi:Alw26I/Eco31I/Esp3I family type II restriction m6 adenine DNA methyltransferase